MESGKKDIVKKWRVAIIVVVALAIFYFVFDPMEWRFMPQCVFHRVTGLQCVGCGSQRMLHALLHGDIAGAFRANAFVMLSLPAIAFLAWVEMQRKRRPNLYRKVYSTTLIVTAGVLMAAWMLVRNIIGI